MTETTRSDGLKRNLHGRAAFRVANGAFALIFLFAAAVQYNDPDPLPWIAIYIAASIACVLTFRASTIWYFSAFVGTIALVWALTIAPRLFGASIPLDQVFGTMKMANVSVEETREALGLLIIAGWMLFLTLTTLKK